MNILERELEDMVYAALTGATRVSPVERGLPFSGQPNAMVVHRCIRQFQFPPYGVIDILLVDAEVYDDAPVFASIVVHVVELKRGKLGYQELGQISRYVYAIKRLLSHSNLNRVHRGEGTVGISVMGYLIGSEIDTSSDFVYLLSQVQGIDAFTYSLDFDQGMLFQQVDKSNWRRSGESLADSELARLVREAADDVFKKAHTVFPALTIDAAGNLTTQE